MPISQITAPPTAPLRSSPGTYAARREAWLTWEEQQLFPGLSGAIAGLNAAEPSLSAILAATNFKGTWASLGSSAVAMPATVNHSGKFWVLLQNLANASTQTPGSAPTYWAELPADTEKWAQIGTTVTLASPTAVIDFTSGLSSYRDLMLVCRSVKHNNGANANPQLRLFNIGASYPVSSAVPMNLGAAAANTTYWNGTITIENASLGYGAPRILNGLAAGVAQMTSYNVSTNPVNNYHMDAAQIPIAGLRLTSSAGSLDTGTKVALFGRGAPITSI